MPSKKPRTIQAGDLYAIELISEARLSPDGQHAVYAQHRVDQKTEKKYANLWVAPTDTPKPAPAQFTFGDQSDSRPRWSPDGSQIAFLSNRKNKDKPAQLYLIPFQGGEARQLCEIEGAIGDFAWSPDGKQLVCMVRKTDPEKLERDKDPQKKELGVVARRYERLFYKLDGFGYMPNERWHLWSVNAATGKAKQLTDHAVYDETSPAWSPDGKWIVFTSNRSPDPDVSREVDLWVMPSGGGEFRKIATPVGHKSQPALSPDGEWIAYYGIEGEGGNWYKNESLWVVPFDGSAPPENLTAKYDLHVSSGVISDQAQPENPRPIWSNDGQRLVFPVARHGSSLVMSISRSGDDLQTVIPEGGTVGSLSFDRDQKRLMFFQASMDDPGQLYIQETGSTAARPLTQVNRDLLKKIDLGVMECHWIKGPDGNDLQGWILKPPGFDPAKKYPSILEIHGGPLTQYGNSFMHEFYFLAARGFVVHFSNPRGGRGYGEEHAKAIWGGWGEADYADLMAWTDFVQSQPYIDPERMGVTGGSYGGYMTIWIIGHTYRFKAALSQRCVSNLISLWGASDMNWVFQEILNDKPPFEDLQKYWQHSPIAHIGNAKTPTKIIHNENDLRCPIEQSEQVFVALKRLGVETEMVRFPDEFHGLSRSGRTDRRISRLNHIAGWFVKYLEPEA
jgi:dipeptidyl aminopeptidase/acylaminoacyl peptidase